MYSRSRLFSDPYHVQRGGGGQEGAGLWDKIANWTTGSNMRSGERHVLLYTPEGFKSSSYMGPSTHLHDRVKEGVEPITSSDRTAFAHDLRYHFANSHDDIRAADKKMVSKLDEIQKNKGDYLFNIYQGKLGIKAKMALENAGIAKPENFTTFGEWKEDSPEDQKMLRDKLNQLEQEGYGRSKTTGRYISWNQHVKQFRAKHPGMTYKQALRAASASYRKNARVNRKK